MRNISLIASFVFLLISFMGCKKEITPTPVALSITISADKTIILADGKDLCTLTVKDNTGKDITSLCQFSSNSIPMAGNTFATTTLGKYEIKARYNSIESGTVVIEAKTSIGFTGRVLVEDYTGTWCGYCPRVAYKIDDAKAKNRNVLAMAIHNGDAMATSYEPILRNRYGVTGFPTAVLNRSTKWDENYSSLLPFIKMDVPVGIAIESSVSAGNATAKVMVKFKDATLGNLKIAAYITEDNVVASQANYYNDGRGNPIVGFRHMNVLRDKMTKELLGDPIPSTSIVGGGVYVANLSILLKGSWISASCKVLVLVTDGSTDQVVNVQEVALGQNIGY
jgi:thiol-disulfide isomerase/thioredoxin